MKYTHFLTLLFLIVIATVSCQAQDENLVTKEKFPLDKILEKLNKTEPLTKEVYQKWVPKKLGNLKLVEHKVNTKIDGSKSTSNIKIIFKNEMNKIELVIIDCAKNTDDIEMIYFAFSMEEQFKKEHPKKDTETKKDKVHHISKYNEDKKQSQILYVINERFAVSAVGDDMKPELLWDYLKKLPLEKLSN